MIDSGSDEQCCPPRFAPQCKLREEDRDLRDVQDGVIETFGKRALLISMEPGDPWGANAVDFLCDLVCGKATQASFSLVKLMGWIKHRGEGQEDVAGCSLTNSQDGDSTQCSSCESDES